MAWTGDVVSNLNNIFKNVDMNGIIDIAVYENPFWARINKTIDTESFYTGNGYRMSLKTGRPHNARPRGDSKDVAWVHLTVGSVNAMKVHFIDGETSTVHANRKDAERLLGFMVQRAPGAIFGFGPGQQKQFVERQKAHRP